MDVFKAVGDSCGLPSALVSADAAGISGNIGANTVFLKKKVVKYTQV